MTLGLYEERARRRRSRRWATLRWILVLAAIGAIAVFAYESGRSLAEAESSALRDEIAEVSGNFDQSQKRIAQLEAELAAAQQARQSVEARYSRDIPQGALGRMLAVVQDRLDAGIGEERLIAVLRTVENERECEEGGAAKRFIVTTVLTGGQNNSVRVADGRVTVTAEGDSALSADGKPEAWFDTAKPVTLRLEPEEGEPVQQVGVLPLSPTIVIGEREHIVTVAPGRRGFVEVIEKSCRYP